MDFASIAAVKNEDLPEVKLLPAGTYIWAVDKQPETKPSANGNSTLINFRCKCIGPIEEFEGDDDELASYGDPAGSIRTLMFVYPEAQYDEEDAKAFERRQASAIQRLNAFLERDLQVEGGTVKERLAGSPNHQFLGTIEHEIDNRNPDVMRDRLQRTAPRD